MKRRLRRLELPNGAVHIIEVLNKNGYAAYTVGGCIRDCLLGRTPSDWDITTGAMPGQVKSLFARTVDTGVRHGTVSVFIGSERYEVTTFRTESGYSDHRHPDKVYFSPSIEDDLKRRDFTINAMAYHPGEGLVDLFGGVESLKRKTIETVGKPSDRFREDALRMLRAIRFSAQLGFEIEAQTFCAISDNRDLISEISMERIKEETDLLLLSGNPLRFSLVWKSGMLKWIIPGLNNVYGDLDGEVEVMDLLLPISLAKKDRIVRWSLLLCPVDDAGAAMRRLRFDKKSSGMVSAVVKSISMGIKPEPCAVRRAVYKVGKPVLENLLDVWDAILESGSGMCGEVALKCGIRSVYDDVVSRGHPVELKDLAIDGHDIIRLGFKGKDVGRILDLIMRIVIRKPELNEKEKLLLVARKLDSY